jgi:hypothetical protein
MQLQVASIPTGTVAASFLGLIAAAIVWLTLAGTPPLGSDRAALIALVVVGFSMCVASGLGSAAGTPPPTGPLSLIAGGAGLLSVFVLLAVVAGWTAVVDPLAGVIYGRASTEVADKVGVVTVGALIAVAWFLATLRQVGVLSSTAG